MAEARAVMTEAERNREAFVGTGVLEFLVEMREAFGDVRIVWARNDTTGFELGHADEQRGVR